MWTAIICSRSANGRQPRPATWYIFTRPGPTPCRCRTPGPNVRRLYPIRKMRKWSIEHAPADEDLAVIAAGVIEFGRAEAAGGNPKPIASFLREDNAIIAGATGRTEFDRLFVNYLWVKKEFRGTGLGSAVLKSIEDAACERGARDSLIETLSDRNASLYRRCRYVEIASIPRYVGPFTKYVMLKKLRPR